MISKLTIISKIRNSSVINTKLTLRLCHIEILSYRTRSRNSKRLSSLKRLKYSSIRVNFSLGSKCNVIVRHNTLSRERTWKRSRKNNFNLHTSDSHRKIIFDKFNLRRQLNRSKTKHRCCCNTSAATKKINSKIAIIAILTRKLKYRKWLCPNLFSNTCSTAH